MGQITQNIGSARDFAQSHESVRWITCASAVRTTEAFRGRVECFNNPTNVCDFSQLEGQGRKLHFHAMVTWGISPMPVREKAHGVLQFAVRESQSLQNAARKLFRYNGLHQARQNATK
jgi:hypothetical protein